MLFFNFFIFHFVLNYCFVYEYPELNCFIITKNIIDNFINSESLCKSILYVSPVSPVFHTAESVRLPFNREDILFGRIRRKDKSLPYPIKNGEQHGHTSGIACSHPLHI